MCRRRPSKLSSPAAANVLALTARSSVRASPQDALTSHPRRPSATPLRAERRAVRARVGAAAETVGVETDQLGVAHQIAPAVDHLDVVASPAQLLRDAGREPILHAQAPRGLAHVRPKSQRGASMAACGPSPRSTTRVTSAACVCGCPSPPIVPYTKRGRPRSRYIDGMSVCAVRLRGARWLGWRGSSEKYAPRFCSSTPVSPATTPAPNS